MRWEVLDSAEALEKAIKASNLRKVALFKHSTRCSISSTAKDRIERQWNFDENAITIYYLDLIKYRSISNQIAEITGIPHESPQLIILHNEQVIYHASHSEIMPRFIPEDVVA